MIKTAKTTKNLNLESKKQVDCSKHKNKRKGKKCYVLIKKRHMKGEKQIAPMDFAEYLRKSDFSENSKICYLLQNGLHERHWYFIKSR